MKLVFPAAAATSSQADRLATLAGFWQESPKGKKQPTPREGPDALRNGLNEVALEAETSDQGHLASALRRVALLSEVWECLECEPEHSGAAAEVAGFCLTAIERLASAIRTQSSSGETEISDEILRQSDERWGDYFSPVDSTSAGHDLVDELVPGDDDYFAQDDAPPALDQATLLSLLQGAGPGGKERKPPEKRLSEPSQKHERREKPTAETERLPRAAVQPATFFNASPRDAPSPAETIATSEDPGVKIPPLPARFDLDDEIKEAFLADAVDLFERIEIIVTGLGRCDNQCGAIHELGRCFHTLKGAAGSVGLIELATFVHELEEQLGQSSGHVSQRLNNLLHQAVSYLDRIISWLSRRPAVFHQTTAMPASEPGVVFPPAALAPDSSVGSRPAVTEPIPVADTPPEDGPIRVPAARFDELTDLASELILQGRFWVSQAQSMKTFASTVQDSRSRLLGSLDRLHDIGLYREIWMRSALIEPETDIPAQLRRLEEQADDLAVLAATAQAAAAPMADRGDTLVRLSLQLWDSLQSLRIVPIRGLFQRLARVAHDAARVEGRQVEVVMKGEETGVDRVVQNKAFEPLLHVVRNAVGHGIESPADRIRAGKPATGCVTLEARREGNTLVVVVRDDGKGLDDLAIADKARGLGWLGPDEKPSQERLHAFLFRPGFSTKTQANAISGRGVGMDVVAREVERLRGTLDLVSEPMRGTQLTIRLPARLALEPALIVRVAGQPLAVPTSQVEHAQPFESSEFSPDDPHEVGRTDRAPSSTGNMIVTYSDQVVPVVFAREMLGIDQSFPAMWPKLVLVRARCRLIGLVVDAIEGAEDLVIKPLDALLSGHPLVSGTSLSVNGEVISVLHAPGLERWLNYRTASGAASVPSWAPDRSRVTAEKPLAVLVVDDSISVRRGVARQLCGLGLEVDEVSDGLEALARLRDSHYGLVLTDLEMPKLDGFALLAEIKRSASLRAIPVVVASTRCDPETRRRILELGARALLSKPVEPWELAQVVEPLLSGVSA
jgi:chemotaxis protein histidine kinase CheA